MWSREAIGFKSKADLSWGGHCSPCWVFRLWSNSRTTMATVSLHRCCMFSPILQPKPASVLHGVSLHAVWWYWRRRLASKGACKGFFNNRFDFMWQGNGGWAASWCVSLLPPMLVRLVQPASSAGVSSGRLRESGLSGSIRGGCRLWRLGFEYIPLWSTAAPPPPAIIIFPPEL